MRIPGMRNICPGMIYFESEVHKYGIWFILVSNSNPILHKSGLIYIGSAQVRHILVVVQTPHPSRGDSSLIARLF